MNNAKEAVITSISVEQWKERVPDLCRKKPSASMVNISRMPDARGENDLCSAAHSNVFIWIELDKNLVTAICELLVDGKIEMRSTSTLVYLVDGAVLRFPIAKSERSYKKPHWIPVVINLAKNSRQ